jgi:1,4-dihydroxy-2-naphthoate octaprenyltransferase
MESEELKTADTITEAGTGSRTDSNTERTEPVAEAQEEARGETPVEVQGEVVQAARPAAVQVEERPEVQRKATRPAHNGKGARVVTADSVEAEQVPTIPLDSLQTINSLQPEVSVHAVTSTRTVSSPEPLVVQPSEYRRGLGDWVQIWRDGMRLNFLWLVVAPVLLGTVLAWSQTVKRETPFGLFHLTHFVGLLIGVLLFQIGANLVNDYYDYLRGVDTSNTLGPGGLIQQGHVRPTRVLVVGLVLLGVGALLGLIMAIRGGGLAILFSLLAVVCAYFYSATKYSLSSKGLGELVSFFIFGPVLTLGAYMIQTGGQLHAKAFIYSLALGFLAAATFFANNMRDIEGDEHAGKRTLANLMGMTLSRIAYVVLLLATYALVVPQGILPKSPHLILITLWTLPMLVVAISGALRTNAPASFHLLMRQTIKLEVVFVVLLIVALFISAIVPVLPQIQFSLLKI